LKKIQNNTLGKGSYVSDVECPRRNQSSSAMWGAYGESNNTKASIINLGCLSHWKREIEKRWEQLKKRKRQESKNKKIKKEEEEEEKKRLAGWGTFFKLSTNIKKKKLYCTLS
jgi:hypothetical protein